VSPRPLASPTTPQSRPASCQAGAGPDPLTLDLVVPMLDRAGLESLPPQGATPEAVEAWVGRFLDTSAHPAVPEIPDGR
jgi:hypothetical protein